MSRREITKLSGLQKKLLRTALMAYHRTPLDLAGGSSAPGSFGIAISRDLDMETGCQLPISDHRERANRRAAAGHAIARLVKRGLLESCGRGAWRLTRAGLKVARQLYPEILPMTKRELAGQIALREAVHSVGPRRQRRATARKTSLPAKEAGIEIAWE